MSVKFAKWSLNSCTVTVQWNFAGFLVHMIAGNDKLDPMYLTICNTAAFWHRLGLALQCRWFKFLLESATHYFVQWGRTPAWTIDVAVFNICIFRIYDFIYLLTNILLFLWVRELFFLILFTQVQVCEYVCTFGQHCYESSFSFVSSISVARVSNYWAKLVLCLWLSKTVLLVCFNDNLIFQNCIYKYCSLYFNINNVYYNVNIIQC